MAQLRKNSRLAAAAIAVLEAERPITLRGLLYRLVSSGELPSTAPREYQRLGRLMTLLRENGSIPRTWIVDHLRQTLKPSSWSGLGDFGDSVRSCYRKDYWSRLPHYVCVFVEKDAIAATIQPVTEEHDVNLHVCRGYASVSFAGEIADDWDTIDKPIFAYYLGDFDPSGFDIERDLREKLERYTESKYFYEVENEDAAEWYTQSDCVIWQRLGVRETDFDDHSLIRLAIKAKDRRAASFIKRYGTSCAEVDAIPPTELRRRVLEAVESHIDMDEWNRLVEIEQVEKASLHKFTASWGEACA